MPREKKTRLGPGSRPISTRLAAEVLGITPGQLRYVLNKPSFRLPLRNVWGYFEWRLADIRRAERARAFVRPVRSKHDE